MILSASATSSLPVSYQLPVFPFVETMEDSAVRYPSLPEEPEECYVPFAEQSLPQRGVSARVLEFLGRSERAQHPLLEAKHLFLGASQLAFEGSGLTLATQPEEKQGTTPVSLLSQMSFSPDTDKLLISGAMAIRALENAKEPAKKVATRSGRLSSLANGRLASLIFSHVRTLLENRINNTGDVPPPFYSIAMILPMTNLNAISNSLGNQVKELFYLLAREFFNQAPRSVASFLENLTVLDLLRDYESPLGQTTTMDGLELIHTTEVNGTLVALQLTNSLDGVEDFLNNMVLFFQKALTLLFTERRLLQASNDFRLTEEKRQRLKKIDRLVGNFIQEASGEIFYDDPNLAEKKSLKELFLDQIYAGATRYQMSLDEEIPRKTQAPEVPLEERLHNYGWMLLETHRARDAAIKNAELAAEQKGTRLLIDEPGAAKRTEQVWREGRFLASFEILNLLQLIISDTDFSLPGCPRKYETDLRPEIIRKKRQTASRSRVFKGVSFDDIKHIAPLVAEYYLTYLNNNGLSSVTQATDKTALTDSWVSALQNLSAKEAPHPAVLEFVQALQLMFKNELTDSRLVALFHECGGFVDPQRILRKPEDLQARLFDIIISFIELSPDAFDYENKKNQLLSLLLETLDDAAQFFHLVEHDLRDGVTRPRELAPAAALDSIENYYGSLEASGVSVPKNERGFLIVGIEAKNAKVLDREANPVRARHFVDINLGAFGFVPTQAAAVLFGLEEPFSVFRQRESAGDTAVLVSAVSAFPFLGALGLFGSSATGEADKQGDEATLVVPLHTRDGALLSIINLDRALRAVLRTTYPQNNLHYNHKQKVGKDTLRLKLFVIETKEALDGLDGAVAQTCRYTIAAKADAFNGGQDQRFWVVETDGGPVKNDRQRSLDSIQLSRPAEKVEGPLSVRLVAIARNLGPESNREELVALLDQDINLSKDLDSRVKEQEFPEQGIWLYSPEEDCLVRIVSAATP